MFKKIVIGIDGLDGGREALALARRLAQHDAELLLVHAYPLEARAGRFSEADYEVLLREDAKRALDDVDAGERPTRRIPVPDLSPARALHRVAEDEAADLIVVGSCRRGPVDRVLAGDVARSTLHGAPCAVAVAPRGYAGDRPIERIAVGYTINEEAKAAVFAAATLANELGAELRAVTAVSVALPVVPGYGYTFDVSSLEDHERVQAEHRLRAALHSAGARGSIDVFDGSAGSALEAVSKNTDLIVAGSRGWGPLHRVLLGSTTDHLVHHAACPVLVVHSGVGESAEPEPASTTAS